MGIARQVETASGLWAMTTGRGRSCVRPGAQVRDAALQRARDEQLARDSALFRPAPMSTSASQPLEGLPAQSSQSTSTE